MEQMLIKSVAKDANVARVMIVGLPDEPGICLQIFSAWQSHINVDISSSRWAATAQGHHLHRPRRPRATTPWPPCRNTAIRSGPEAFPTIPA